MASKGAYHGMELLQYDHINHSHSLLPTLFETLKISVTDSLIQRGRAYPFIGKPHYQAVGGPNGGPECAGYGCNAYSLGDERHRELLLPLNYRIVLDWLQDVVNDPNYENKDLGFPVEKEDNGEEDTDQGHEGEEDVWSAATMAVAQEGEPTVSVIDVSSHDDEVMSETSKVNVIATAIDDSSEAEVEVIDLTPDTPEEEAYNYDIYPGQAAAANFADDHMGESGLGNGQAEYNGYDNEDDGYLDESDFDGQEVDTEPIKAWAWKVGPEAGELENEPDEAKAKYKSAKCGVLEARARLDQAKEQYDIAAAQVDKVEVERQTDRTKLVQLDAELDKALAQVRDFDRNVFQTELDAAISIPYIPAEAPEVVQISSWKVKVLEFRECVSTFIEKTNSYLTQAKDYEQKIDDLKDTFKTMKTYRDAYAQTLKKYTEIVQSLMNDSETEDSETDVEAFDRESDSTKADIGGEAGGAHAEAGNGEREQNVTAVTLDTSVAAKSEAIYSKIAANEGEIEANIREMETIEERLAYETLEDKLKGKEAKIEVLKSFLGTLSLKANEGDAEVESEQDLNSTSVLSTADAVAPGDYCETIREENADIMNGNAAAEK
jgi:hypothetical protein